MYNEIISTLEEKLQKTIGVFKSEINTVRAGRANPALLDGIKIDYYGQQTPLVQVASISVPEARLLVIQPWDASIIELIEKEILKSNLGINPVNDGKIIRLPFPELTEDRRKELAKVVKKMAEDSKVALRNTRRDAVDKIKKLEKDSLIREDEKFIAEEEVEKTMNKYMEELEKILKSKEKELLEI